MSTIADLLMLANVVTRRLAPHAVIAKLSHCTALAVPKIAKASPLLLY
jgi:hypothetical protein